MNVIITSQLRNKAHCVLRDPFFEDAERMTNFEDEYPLCHGN